jgi:C_GCAxxG_C_C family probable redox protein
MDSLEQSVALFRQGFSCSQAVLATFAPGLGLDSDTALRLSAGFGGGMGRMALTCGAVTGAFMVLGLRHGGTRAEETAAKARTRHAVREFAQRFREQHGSIECRELLGCDLSTPEGYAEAMRQQLTTTICPRLVATVAEILQDMLTRPDHGPGATAPGA